MKQRIKYPNGDPVTREDVAARFEGRPERLQVYFDDGLEVYRAAPGIDPVLVPIDKQVPPPFHVCTATSKGQAQRIANALNHHLPLKERIAMERIAMEPAVVPITKTPELVEREQRILRRFRIRSGNPERDNT